MKKLSALELLNIWGQGCSQPPYEQALSLLAAAMLEIPVQELEKMSIGKRDACLLKLREQTFGSCINGLIDCPQCGEKAEFYFDTSDICMSLLPETAGVLSFSLDKYKISFRLPNSKDMTILSGCNDVAEARQMLLSRCLIKARHMGALTTLEQLPESVVNAMVQQMAEVDPHADIQLSLTCPACNHNWFSAFDIATFLWSELNAWAHHIMHEVRILAFAYGWSEADILAMSPWRRHAYMEMISK